MLILPGLRPLLRLAALAAVVAVTPSAALAQVPACLPPSSPSQQAETSPPLCRAYTADGTEIAWDDLVQHLAGVPVVLLGEIHDNGAQHRIRAQLLLALGSKWQGARKPALVSEHITTDQALALTAFRALDKMKQRETTEFFAALDWEKSGWPKAELFDPLFAAALDLEWPILPGNAPKAKVRAVARQGVAGIPQEEADRLGLATPLPETAQSSLLDELEASHCGLMPRTAFGGMADAQRYRDAHMAHALIDAVATHGRAVLIAGNGHVRRDRGAPWHVARMAPAEKTASVIFSEISPDKSQATDYLQRGTDGTAIADFVIVTPRAERPDPCERMRARAKR